MHLGSTHTGTNPGAGLPGGTEAPGHPQLTAASSSLQPQQSPQWDNRPRILVVRLLMGDP